MCRRIASDYRVVVVHGASSRNSFAHQKLNAVCVCVVVNCVTRTSRLLLFIIIPEPKQLGALVFCAQHLDSCTPQPHTRTILHVIRGDASVHHISV